MPLADLPQPPQLEPAPVVSTPGRNADAADGSSNLVSRATVLHVINGEHYSGAERVQDLLALRLPETGFDVEFVCVKPGRFPRQRRAQSTPLHELPMEGRWDWRAAGRLRRLLQRHTYQVLHAHTPRTALLVRVASAGTGIPWVYHVHSPAARDGDRAVWNWLNRIVERVSLRNADHLIAVSQSLAQHMRTQGFPSQRITVVPNGVPGHPWRGERQSPDGRWVLGTVALFRPRKGAEVLLEAVARLRRLGYDVTLRAVGPFETPEYQHHLQNLARRMGLHPHVRWIGFTSTVDTELAQMDLFVLPSLYGEGLPMVVLEAMAAGVPVIATNVEGIPEAIRNGIDGAIVPAADPEAIARRAAGMIDDPTSWQAMRTQARQRQIQHFSDETMTSGVAAVYRRILGRAPQSSQRPPSAQVD